MFKKIFDGEMILNIQHSALFQISADFIFCSENIFQKVLNADDTCTGEIWAGKG